MKIYTKTGDSGKTGLLNDRVSKTSLRIEVNGQLDETMVLLAFLIEELKNKYDSICKEVKVIYKDLFTITSMIADIKNYYHFNINDSSIEKLEKSIDEMSKDLPVLKNFIYYTGSKTAMLCHHIRAKIRSVERTTVRLFETEEIDNMILSYLNRLSDYFYTLARYLNKLEGIEEDILTF